MAEMKGLFSSHRWQQAAFLELSNPHHALVSIDQNQKLVARRGIEPLFQP